MGFLLFIGEPGNLLYASTSASLLVPALSRIHRLDGMALEREAIAFHRGRSVARVSAVVAVRRHPRRLDRAALGNDVVGVLFTLTIPLITLSDGYLPLLLGCLLQGVSGGLIGVIVPLYLAECLHARHCGRDAALFQLLLTIGLVAAVVIGLLQAHSVELATVAAQ